MILSRLTGHLAGIPWFVRQGTNFCSDGIQKAPWFSPSGATVAGDAP
jgi:hypothetical protein